MYTMILNTTLQLHTILQLYCKSSIPTINAGTKSCSHHNSLFVWIFKIYLWENNWLLYPKCSTLGHINYTPNRHQFNYEFIYKSRQKGGAQIALKLMYIWVLFGAVGMEQHEFWSHFNSTLNSIECSFFEFKML